MSNKELCVSTIIGVVIWLGVLVYSENTKSSFAESNAKINEEIQADTISKYEAYKAQIEQEYVPEIRLEDVHVVRHPMYDTPLDEELELYIEDTCDAYCIDPTLVYAIIEKESTYNTDAINYNGSCVGLMQVAPKWHKDRMERLDVANAIEAHNNVLIGVDCLAELFEKYEDVGLVLMCYNMGENGAKAKWNKGIYTTGYVNKVLAIQERILDAEQFNNDTQIAECNQ